MSTEEPVNQQVEQQQKKLRMLSLYQTIFDSDIGEEVLADICSGCHVLGSTFDKDPVTMAYREGRRSVAMGIMKALETDMNKLRKMMGDNRVR